MMPLLYVNKYYNVKLFYHIKRLVFSAVLRQNTLYEKVSYSKGVYFSGAGTGCFGHYF